MRLLLPATLLVLAVGLTACSGGNEATRDEAGAVASAGSIDAFLLEDGDCLNQPFTEELEESEESEELEEVRDIEVVPCGDPHDGEVYETLDLPDGDFPGDEAVSATTDEACVAAFAPFVGTPVEESSLGFFALQPTEESWAQDDREIVCVIGDPEAQTTGSLKGATR